MKAGLIGVLAVAAALVGAVALSPNRADAAPPSGGLSTQIPCEIGGVASTCTLTVTSFKVVGGVLTAVGTVTGGGITIPFEAPVIDLSGTCRILDLTIGPINLDLLGLVVDLSRVDLEITAQSGPGNLLGNLLCGIAGLLDRAPTGGGLTVLTQLTNLLNQLLGLLG